MPRPLHLAKCERRCWIYFVIDMETLEIVYVGQTVSLRSRWHQHRLKTSQCALLRNYLQKHGKHCDFRIETEYGLGNGFPQSRANEFEAYFMAKYQTIHDPVRNRSGCNQNNAPHVSQLTDGWERRIEDELDEGYHWPDEIPVDPYDAMGGDILKARQEEAMFADLMQKAPDVPEVEKAYSNAIAAVKKLDPEDDVVVFAVDSPFARARQLKEEYEAMPPHAQVDRDVVAGQLTSVGQVFQYDDEDKSKAELEGMIKLWLKSVHPNNERLHGKPLKAGYAAALFSLAFEWCGDFEEELLLLRMGVDPADEEEPGHVGGSSSEAAIKHKDILQALQWRRWSEANNGAAPKNTGHTAAVQPKEAKLAEAMKQWRNGHGGVARRHQSLYLLLLRHHTWFAPFVRGEKATWGKGGGIAKDVNHHLRLGYGTQAEVQAGVADRVIPTRCGVCGAGNAVSGALGNFLRGANVKHADVILAVGGKLTEARAATLRALHESNIEERKAKGAASHAKVKAAKEANGRAKKRKMEDTDDDDASDDE